MRKILATLTLFVVSTTMAFGSYLPKAEQIYSKLKLQKKGLELDVFEYALMGFDKINSDRDILTIIDFSQSSREKRLYTIDLKNMKLLFNERVTHGVNSGEEYATKFSNVDGTKKTSLGFYLTSTTYNGKYGYSLKLDGLDKGFNDHARDRYIVMHGASYANDYVIDDIGMLGWSWGCPAVRPAIVRRLIDTIKNKTVLFHYADKKDYLQKSKYLQ